MRCSSTLGGVVRCGAVWCGKNQKSIRRVWTSLLALPPPIHNTNKTCNISLVTLILSNLTIVKEWLGRFWSKQLKGKDTLRKSNLKNYNFSTLIQVFSFLESSCLSCAMHLQLWLSVLILGSGFWVSSISPPKQIMIMISFQCSFRPFFCEFSIGCVEWMILISLHPWV